MTIILILTINGVMMLYGTDKPINYLASNVEKLSVAGKLIKDIPIADKLNELQQATTELKSIVKGGLPDEVLNYCWVINYTHSELTLAVNSITARNHIHYIRQNLIELLNKNSQMFKNLTDLKVKVVHLPNI